MENQKPELNPQQMDEIVGGWATNQLTPDQRNQYYKLKSNYDRVYAAYNKGMSSMSEVLEAKELLDQFNYKMTQIYG